MGEASAVLLVGNWGLSIMPRPVEKNSQATWGGIEKEGKYYFYQALGQSLARRQLDGYP